MEKEEIVETLFEIQKQVIADIKERIADTFTMMDLDESDTIDPEDYSHSKESKEMNGLMTIQLERAEKELEKLKLIDFSAKSRIEEGAIVTTDKFTFCVGIATVPFKVGDIDLVGISSNAPIFIALKDKIVGDSCIYGENQYKIIAIN